MVVSRDFMKHEHTLRREIIFKGASEPNKERKDYFMRYTEPEAFHDLTFTYTPQKPWILMAIHTGRRDRMKPVLTGGIKINGEDVQYVYGGNEYWNYPLVYSVYAKVNPGVENTIELKLKDPGHWANVGNGGVHIHEMTHIDEAGVLIHYGRTMERGALGWSITLPEGGLQAGDIAMLSMFSVEPTNHPLYGMTTHIDDFWNSFRWDIDMLKEFKLGEGGYSASGTGTIITQEMLDTDMYDLNVRASKTDQFSAAHIILRNAII